MNITFEQAARIFSAIMQVAFFFLMCIGLLLASVFLYLGMITGDNWFGVCGILFAADRVSAAIAGRVRP